MFNEDKQKTCDLLAEMLKSTREFHGYLVNLEYQETLNADYEPVQEYVTATFSNGNETRINVFADSCIALVRDVMREIANL